MSIDVSELDTSRRGLGGLYLGRDGRGENPDAPFRFDHQNSRESELEEVNTASGIQCGTQLKTAPRPVPRVSRGPCGVHDEEEEGEPVGKGEGDGRAADAEVAVVHEVDVQRNIEGGDDDEHVGGCIHDP